MFRISWYSHANRLSQGATRNSQFTMWLESKCNGICCVPWAMNGGALSTAKALRQGLMAAGGGPSGSPELCSGRRRAAACTQPHASCCLPTWVRCIASNYGLSNGHCFDDHDLWMPLASPCFFPSQFPARVRWFFSTAKGALYWTPFALDGAWKIETYLRGWRSLDHKAQLPSVTLSKTIQKLQAVWDEIIAQSQAPNSSGIQEVCVLQKKIKLAATGILTMHKMSARKLLI